jgi:hypothetical protein
VANVKIASGLVRVDTSLSRHQVEDVRQVAEYRQLTSAAIIREAVRMYLASPAIKAMLEGAQEEALA